MKLKGRKKGRQRKGERGSREELLKGKKTSLESGSRGGKRRATDQRGRDKVRKYVVNRRVGVRRRGTPWGCHGPIQARRDAVSFLRWTAFDLSLPENLCRSAERF